MKRVLVNEPLCMGCHLCEVYCQVYHSPSRTILKAFGKNTSRPVPRLRIEERKPVFFTFSCLHCQEPSCVSACLTGALFRNSATGAVIVDETKCIGCWTCVLACPYGNIRPGILNHKAVKCDLCQGAEIPACVLNCPNEALSYEETAEVEIQK
jgi:carbon-monoxide dehydrogenase iron sulfur subunit